MVFVCNPFFFLKSNLTCCNFFLSSRAKENVFLPFSRLLSLTFIHFLSSLSYDRHTLEDGLREHEAGTSLFLCSHRTHIAGKIRKVVHTGTLCKSSAHGATLRIEFILFLLHDARIAVIEVISGLTYKRGERVNFALY